MRTFRNFHEALFGNHSSWYICHSVRGVYSYRSMWACFIFYVTTTATQMDRIFCAMVGSRDLPGFKYSDPC